MNKTKAWMNALQQFEKDQVAQVKCPECNDGYLKVRDVPWPDNRKIDRYLVCDHCGRYNVATLTKHE